MSSKFRDLLFDNIEETVSALGDDVAGLRQQLSEGIESVDDVDVVREHLRRVGNAMKYLDEMFADLDEISKEACRGALDKIRPHTRPEVRMIEEVSQKAHKQFGIPLELARQDVRRVAKVTGFLDAFAAIEAACK